MDACSPIWSRSARVSISVVRAPWVRCLHKQAVLLRSKVVFPLIFCSFMDKVPDFYFCLTSEHSPRGNHFGVSLALENIEGFQKTFMSYDLKRWMCEALSKSLPQGIKYIQVEKEIIQGAQKLELKVNYHYMLLENIKKSPEKIKFKK